MSQRFVFLDIDGVLSTDKSHELPFLEDGYAQFEGSCVSALTCLCDHTKASVVVTSCWREAYRDNDAIRECLRDRRVTVPIVGRTPILRNAGDFERPAEIQRWLDSVGDMVASYVILDDEDWRWPAEMRARWVQTNFETGLTNSHVRQAVQILERAIP